MTSMSIGIILIGMLYAILQMQESRGKNKYDITNANFESFLIAALRYYFA